MAAIVFLAFGQGPRAAERVAADADLSIFRVFLKDGHVLPAYGEPAFVGDRVIFSLVVRPDAVSTPTSMQLMNLPAADVDLDRTTRYARAVRAAYFASTTGEAEYRTLTSELSSTLDALPAIPDPALRMQLAQEARERLGAWSRDHYDYRATEIRRLLVAFDGVIGQLNGSESRLSMALVAGAVDVGEPVLPTPSLREAIEAALFAAHASTDIAVREQVLAGVVDALSPDGAEPELLADARAALADERSADQAYAALGSELVAKADDAKHRVDVKTAEGLSAELSRRDVALGSRRPEAIAMTADAIAARLAVTRAERLALDRYAKDKPALLAYERRVRPTLSALDGLLPELRRLRDGGAENYDATARLAARFQTLDRGFDAITAPTDLADVHAAIQSVIRLAHESCVQHRQSLIAPSSIGDAASSAAAAGAIALLAQARQDLVTHLFPPKFA